jgi:hypothetical protein
MVLESTVVPLIQMYHSITVFGPGNFQWLLDFSQSPSILYIQRQSTALFILGCYLPCRNPCLFDVELATIIQLFNQINRNLVHLKKTVKLYPFLCIHITHSA